MVAFNFTTNIEKLYDGTKQSTIRKTKRCSVGDKMQLYTGLRTKNCRGVKVVECVGTARIKITDELNWVIDLCEGVPSKESVPLHEQEGFKNVRDFVGFFRQHYGLPFVGWLHTWDDHRKTPYPCVCKK